MFESNAPFLFAISEPRSPDPVSGSCSGVGTITCMHWLPLASPSLHPDPEPQLSSCLAVGTAEGVLLVYSPQGLLLLKQVGPEP